MKRTFRKSLSQTKHDNAKAMNFYAAMSDKPRMEVPDVITRQRRERDPNDEPLEHAEQVAVIDWWFHYSKSIGLHPNLLVAVPNAQMLLKYADNPNAAIMYLRREGLRVGMLDLILFVARGEYHGKIIEMKRRTKGVMSDDQKAMVALLVAQGYDATVARGADDAIAQIKNYLRN